MAVDTKSILYFIENSSPTEAELAAAAKLNTAKFRNAGAYYTGDTIEACDGVAGCAPKDYTDRFPAVDTQATAGTPAAPAGAAPWQK
jgi:hypothetical protein